VLSHRLHPGNVPPDIAAAARAISTGELQFLDYDFVGVEDEGGGFVVHWFGKDMIGFIVIQNEELAAAGA
jgi:hypothetical protein